MLQKLQSGYPTQVWQSLLVAHSPFHCVYERVQLFKSFFLLTT